MDVLSVTPAADDVSSWVSFDDYPSPTTPGDDFINPSFFGSSLSTNNFLDGSVSVLCTDDTTDSKTVHPLDLSFDWPSKANLTFPDDDGSNGFGLNDSQNLPMPKIFNDIRVSTPADLLLSNANATATATANTTQSLANTNFAAIAAALAQQQQQQKQFLQFPHTLDLSSLTGQDLANALGLGLDLTGAMRQQKRMRMASDISSFSDLSSVSSSTNSSEFSTPMSSPSLAYSPSGNPLFNASSTVSSAACSPRLTTTLATEAPSTTTTPQRPPRAPRKQSESRIPLPDLHARMGLAHDPDEARSREQHILSILQDQGFPLGERTWIRDTEEKERRRIIEEIYRQTRDLYGYERSLLEVIVRRGAYYLMQGRLRRLRRSKAHQQHLANNNAATMSTTSEHEEDEAADEEQRRQDNLEDMEIKDDDAE
ncbi:hypothetical protein V1525DRAFT_276795 [Lipomyces kononenkoae]|uniref:Uncharacterized protein n=1 Tax=Lipomyces kononenkoae TaxID=34357 RepID=A0ACC3T7R7_LIPKO